MSTPKSKKAKQSSTPKISKAVLTPEFIEMQLQLLEEDDLALCFDLRIINKEGEIFQVKGMSSLPHATRAVNSPVAPKQFENVVSNSMLKPLLQRYNDLIGEQTENLLPPPAQEIPTHLLDTKPVNEDTADAEEEDATEDPPPDPSVMSE